MAGRLGDSPVRKDVETLTGELDEAAWTVQDRVDRGLGRQDDYTAAFRKARAAAVWWNALDEDPLRAALEGLYEAHHAIDDADALADVVDNVLDAESPTG